ncbi:pyrroline-5-carboxylate reductase [Hyphomicrobium denitrificans ATCC 51888]|uniref:Pyrroline-5-carboxylate reductase n=1 Tax=Hyphomicrobium denitrificans (strain ATCC 51888 / DSM 1869 / NCIMB 11706 / TK 0415) TaxID=582899 RepID=D8JSK2_HYPDA|nr:pyrroline-5-carboxylate reductase [Hyphomicrobium denitrificans]ADJ24296.1 pyrroline-5-carboxylate reductase [Hyphomicrobium denitrificans ATCC 51888]
MSFKLDGPVVLAGAGKMGAALLAGWIARGLQPRDVIVQEPNLAGDAAELQRQHGFSAVANLEDLPSPPSVIVVAVKPQAMDSVFPELAKSAGPATVVMSIAAGKSIASFERHLPSGTAVVRAMPNTPAAIGRGITGAVGNAHVTEAQKDLCASLLSAAGEVVWLNDEALIDAVTAVSGSGPAYIFLLAETLARAGEAAGLDAATSMQLARATVSGAGELLHRSQSDPTTLRQNVTSPGGTTAAALSVLMREKGGLQDLLTEAVLAAKKRGRELGS